MGTIKTELVKHKLVTEPKKEPQFGNFEYEQTRREEVGQKVLIRRRPVPKVNHGLYNAEEELKVKYGERGKPMPIPRLLVDLLALKEYERYDIDSAVSQRYPDLAKAQIKIKTSSALSHVKRYLREFVKHRRDKDKLYLSIVGPAGSKYSTQEDRDKLYQLYKHRYADEHRKKYYPQAKERKKATSKAKLESSLQTPTPPPAVEAPAPPPPPTVQPLPPAEPAKTADEQQKIFASAIQDLVKEKVASVLSGVLGVKVEVNGLLEILIRIERGRTDGSKEG